MGSLHMFNKSVFTCTSLFLWWGSHCLSRDTPDTSSFLKLCILISNPGLQAYQVFLQYSLMGYKLTRGFKGCWESPGCASWQGFDRWCRRGLSSCFHLAL